jgi:hypothetical protein
MAMPNSASPARHDEPAASIAALPPAPGSVRYFVLLYTPQAHRQGLASLLAVADEIGAGLERRLDHALAHARLDWWEQASAQYMAGHAQHPLLRVLQQATPPGERLDLQSLVRAAAIDLAEAQRVALAGERARAALFGLAAKVLGATALSSVQDEALRELGALTLRYERARPARDGALADGAALAPILERLGAALQPAIAPLLVWAVLAARHAQQCAVAPKKNTSRLEGFAQNWRAWNVARHAARGNLRIQ